MVEKKVEELIDRLTAIRGKVADLREFMHDVRKDIPTGNTDWIRACLPLKFCTPVEPLQYFDCWPNLAMDRPPTTGDFAATGDALDVLLGDMLHVLEGVEPSTPLPGIGDPL